MIDATALLADTRTTVVDLVDDLREVSTNDPAARAHVADEYQRAHAAGRTSLGKAEWAEGLYAQVAVAWTLACVFVRFCEDNGLIAEPLLGGPGLRAQLALDQRAAYLHAYHAHDDRDWLREVFSRLRALPATGNVFGPHNPIWLEGLLPSADGARRVREELTRIDPGTGQLRHDFADPSWDTRFLGDLYQDLSDHAKKTYALLQTPVFVEEFILDRTLEPAISTFGLADTTIIDPTCGSGHFLLGAFARLFEHWLGAEPGTNRRVLAQRALDAIGGIDLNPYAASIARFRLLLAALRAGGDTTLADAPAYDLSVAVGDSLLHGDPPGALPGMHVPGEEEALLAAHGYAAEDHAATRDLLSRPWAAVVGNPPYIVVRDSAINAAYRARFKTCHRQYSLGVPFTERFWQLARSSSHGEAAGFVGLITANSFMKREFGTRFVESWMPAHDVQIVLDASGAYIPGHGTPTVLLFGRNRPPLQPTVRVVMGIRGEPSKPVDPEKGHVWTSIVDQVDDPGASDQYVSVADLERSRLHHHPWSIAGGGAAELKAMLDERFPTRLATRVQAIGRTNVLGEDDAWLLTSGAARRLRLQDQAVEFVTGEAVRDWRISNPQLCAYPYTSLAGDPVSESNALVSRFLWPRRTILRQRTVFSKTFTDRGEPWWIHLERYTDKLRTSRSIAFAFVSTHNNFVLDRGGRVFNRSAPVVKLSESATDDEHLRLLEVLNSSTAAFWFRQVFFAKPSNGVKRGLEDEAWEQRLEYDGTKMMQLPLPSELGLGLARSADELATSLVELAPSAAAWRKHPPTASSLDDMRRRYQEVHRRLVATQERLDWTMYNRFGLVDAFVVGDVPEPPLDPGERAFEILLTRRMLAGEADSSWFERHGTTAQPELPSHWSGDYAELVERRIALIAGDASIALLEQPEHKRRWLNRSWDEQASAALRDWLLDRLEEHRYWGTGAPITTVNRMAAQARADEDFVSVAQLYIGRGDVDLAALIRDLVKTESVAYVAAWRYSDAGLRKFRDWERTWELERRADLGEQVGVISMPPKYGRPDFTDSGWELRGKLDVPNERFISYPGAERETDASAVIGWAGWDHLEQARALAAWYLQAKRDGRDNEHLTPLLAGLAELVPWLKQWHDEPNADPSLDRPGSQVGALVDTELRSLGLTHDDLAAWRPPAVAKRGRPRKALS